MADLEYGKVAFDAYSDHADYKTHDGKPIPQWDDLTDAVREHWDAAALAAIEQWDQDGR
jgi:hypothetical protein